MLSARRLSYRVTAPSPLRPSLPSHTLFTCTAFQPTPTASSSHLSYATLPHVRERDPKGKGRAYDDLASMPPQPTDRLASSTTRHQRWTGAHSRTPLQTVSRRSFHSTARRDAIPLIPGTIAILKGTSILTAATAFSRIFISFFPIGTLAAFKMARAGRWIETDVVRPPVGPEVEEFWKMWCEGEKEIRLTRAEAMKFVDSEPDDNGALVGEDGRMAWPIPMPPRHRWAKKSGPEYYTPKDIMRHYSGNRRRAAHIITKTVFYMPDLPPASVRFYEDMTPAQRNEVDALRRYWLGLKAFKDHFKFARVIVAVLFGLPVLLLTGVYLAGLERVPLTGRWRLILLTPEEEDAISTSLAGANWYRSVINLLTTAEAPAPAIVPPNDWRWAWVQGVLTRLENAALSDCQHLPESQRPTKDSPIAISIPPPAYHPLKPRPRVSSWLHSCLPGGEPGTGREHLEIGPPYNLMLMEKNERNAFSYGFGGKRAGGIVVFTELLDSILRDKPSDQISQVAQAPPTGFFSRLFSPSSPSASSRRQHAQPTEEQTLHLACVLAHEMGHLLLSHHVETLSQQQVLWPSILGLSMDLLRAFIWPFTVFLGPTVNDALANMGRTSTEELSDRYGEIGFQWIHEYEADLAGLRILALAGFDPQLAVSHFESSVADLHEIQPIDKAESTWTGSMFKLWTRGTHPSAEKRMLAIKDELKRWETVRLKEAEGT